MIIHGDSTEVLKTLDAESVDCCITSPPYFGLRDYGIDGQIGLESTVDEYVSKLVGVFNEVRRVLKAQGTLWLNLGDSYNAGRNGGHAGGGKQGKSPKYVNRSGPNIAGLKAKDLIGIPWTVAFALRNAGWYLRQDIIWHKPNPMPESVTDRCTKAHEYIFLLTKKPKYYFDHESIKEPVTGTVGHLRNEKQYGLKGHDIPQVKIDNPGLRLKRSVWTITTKPFKGAHFATFPPDLIEPCVLAGCHENGIVLDPFMGSGTVGLVAKKHSRSFIGIELNAEYIKIAEKRIG